MQEHTKIPKLYIDLLDQIFEIERKANAISESNSISRNVNRIKQIFETVSGIDAGLSYENPIDEIYSDTRTDLEASIAGVGTDNLVITEVIKPIIRFRQGAYTTIARKGIVIVESKKENL